MVQKNHATVKLDSNGFSRNETYSERRIELKSTNLKENAGKIKALFVTRAALCAATCVRFSSKVSGKNYGSEYMSQLRRNKQQEIKMKSICRDKFKMEKIKIA